MRGYNEVEPGYLGLSQRKADKINRRRQPLRILTAKTTCRSLKLLPLEVAPIAIGLSLILDIAGELNRVYYI